MSYHTYEQLNPQTCRSALLKRIMTAIVLSCILVTLSSCTLLTKPLDNRTGFSEQLAQVESSIRNENWAQAKISLADTQRTWKKLKPILQIDIDHDFIKDIEDSFTKLDGFLDTNDKSNSLVSILLIKDTWKKIGSL